jgi:hypothetical protein
MLQDIRERVQALLSQGAEEEGSEAALGLKMS